MSTNLPFNIAGKRLALLETEVKDNADRKYHCFRVGEKASGFGQQVPALAQDLPKTVEVDGIVLALTVGMSPATTTRNGEKIAVPEHKRYPQATYRGDHTFPSLVGFDGPEDKGIRRVSVTISVPNTAEGAVWNVKVQVNRIPSVSPEDRKAQAIEKATSNLAALMALMDAQSEAKSA